METIHILIKNYSKYTLTRKEGKECFDRIWLNKRLHDYNTNHKLDLDFVDINNCSVAFLQEVYMRLLKHNFKIKITNTNENVSHKFDLLNKLF